MLIAAIQTSERSFAHYYDPNGIELQPGDVCLVEDKQVQEALGRVSMMERRASIQMRRVSYPRVLRKATDQESEQFIQLRQREIEAIRFAKDKAREFGLDMKIFSVRFDDRQRRVIFHFTAENRVDFRQLVKIMAGQFRARIELWQVGVRDESKAVHGFGMCGRELCCGSWIQDFMPVSIRQAKDQGLALSPSRLSGQCGRLRCCLTYEHEVYREALKAMPNVGALCVAGDLGEVAVLDRNPLKRELTVRDAQDNLRLIPASMVDKVIGRATAAQMRRDDARPVPIQAVAAANGEEAAPPEEAETTLARLEDKTGESSPPPAGKIAAPLEVRPDSESGGGSRDVSSPRPEKPASGERRERAGRGGRGGRRQGRQGRGAEPRQDRTAASNDSGAAPSRPPQSRPAASQPAADQSPGGDESAQAKSRRRGRRGGRRSGRKKES